MKKAFSAAGCLLLGALAAWTLPLTMVLRESIEALTNSTALLLVALAFALLIRRAERSGCLGVPEMVMGVLFSAMLVLGSELSLYAEHAFARNRLPMQAVAILAFSSVPASLLAIARPSVARTVVVSADGKADVRGGDKTCFFGLWIVIALCYLPAWIAYFPAITSYDTDAQMRQIYQNAYSNGHPLLHTGILALCTGIGGGGRAGVAIYAGLQILCMSGAYAFVCTRMRSWGIPKALWMCAAAYFALWPTHAMLAITITKDVLFTGLFIIGTALVIDALRAGRSFFAQPRQAVRLCLVLALMCMMRHNGVASVLALSVGLIAASRGGRVRMAALCAASLCFYGGMNALLNVALHAAPDNGNVLFSVPAQQIAAAVNNQPDRISEEERTALNELFSSGALEYYIPFLADPVKEKVVVSALQANPKRYLDMYLSIGRKCPGSYLSAALALNCGLWYPDNTAHVTVHADIGQGYIETIDYFNWPDEKLNRPGWLPRTRTLYEAFASVGTYRKVGVFSILFAPGIYTWLLIASTFLLCRVGRRRAVVALLPCWGLVPVLLLGPVINVRYVYPMMAAAPVMLALLIGNPLKQEAAS